jgi:hypothetical protein
MADRWRNIAVPLFGRSMRLIAVAVENPITENGRNFAIESPTDNDFVLADILISPNSNY